MMSSQLALLLLANALLLLIGLGLLPLFGVARSPKQLAMRAGLAYLAGLAAGGVISASLALVGVATGWPVLGALAAASLTAGAFRLNGSLRPRLPRKPGTVILASLSAFGLLAFFVHAGRAFAVAPLLNFDGWAIWALKGHMLALLGWADPGFFANRQAFIIHREYPLLLPSLEAIDIRAMGEFNVQLLHVQLLLFAPAAVTAFASLLSDRTAAVVLWPSLLALATAPGLLGELYTARADLPLAIFFSVGAVAAGRWLLTGEGWALALAALFFGAACLTKSEGALFALAAVVALGLQLIRDCPRRLVPLAVAAAAALCMLLPWRIFLFVHDLHETDYHFSDSFDLGYVSGRLNRGPTALGALLESLVDPRHWSLLGPLFLVATAAAFLARRGGLAWYGLTLILLGLAGLTWVYIISPISLPSYLHETTDRVTASLVLAGAALAPLLASEAQEASMRSHRRTRRPATAPAATEHGA